MRKLFFVILGTVALANIIYLYTSQKGQIIWFCSILIGYWLLFILFAAPGFHSGDLTMEGNVVSYVDRMLMPGKLYLGIHDPEGLLSTVPATGTALLGIFAGKLLRNDFLKQQNKVILLLIAGITFLVLAQIWNIIFPINKNIWTSSFVLQAGGISLILLAVFYYVIDVLGYKSWAFFFKVIGVNSILIYISGIFIDFNYTTNALFHWLVQLVREPYQVVIFAICIVVIKWLFLYFLYKKKTFLRV